MAFLPMTIEECEQRGFSRPDFVLITGDAYVDHPSFGAAIIGKVLQSRGFTVAVIAQPDWRSVKDFKRFGRPRLGFLITGGNVDSMVSNYSVFKYKRKKDAYAPGGEPGKRPDRAVIVYGNRVKESYKGIPVIIGGLEASLRRFAHYDYWDNKVRRSILIDSRADLLVYGMGEKSICEIAEALDAGIAVQHITWIRGTCYKQTPEQENVQEFQNDEDTLMLPSYEKITTDKKAYCRSFVAQYQNSEHISGKRLVEEYTDGLYVVQNPPMQPLERHELDDIYELPFERTYPNVYDEAGGVPSIEEVEFGIIGSRGCFGSCAFCALTYHQGKDVRSRSKESIVKEAKELAAKPGFKGYIHDIGGPTANFRNPPCEKQRNMGACKHKSCLYPFVCKEMNPDHSEYLDVLKSVRELKGIKKVFIRSGIRYDYVLADHNSNFIEELCKYHVSGTLKVAPEHVSKNVLAAMRKPGKGVFESFSKKFNKTNERLGLKQYLVPYFVSSHPGSTLADAIELALYFKNMGFIPEQVQDFYPTPGTLSTCMYYTGMDPFTLTAIHVPNTFEEKRMQRALLHFHKPENRQLVEKALEQAGRPELKQVLLGKRASAPERKREPAGKTKVHQERKRTGAKRGKHEPNRKTSKHHR
ncbi:MAG: YgiQ family radical SAM protein [Clostridiales bacterium]|nr:YgiQ family radical SAM protein [Clostridiales bacterium]